MQRHAQCCVLWKWTHPSRVFCHCSIFKTQCWCVSIAALYVDWEGSGCLWPLVHCSVWSADPSLMVPCCWYPACLPASHLLLFLLIQMPRQAKALRFNNNVPVFVSMWQVNIVKVYHPGGVWPPPFFVSALLHRLAQRTPGWTERARKILRGKGNLRAISKQKRGE